MKQEINTMSEIDRLLQSYKSGRMTTTEVLEHLQSSRIKKTTYPLSQGQRGLWSLHKMAPEAAVYNIPLALRLHGLLNPIWLQQALDALITLHPVLACAIRPEGDEICHVHMPARAVTLQQTRLPAGSDDDLLHHLKQLAKASFVLEDGPLLRASLIEVDHDDHVLLLVTHHIVTDGRSLQIMVSTLLDHYGALARGVMPKAEPLPAQYADFVAWEQALLSSDKGHVLRRYWQEQLALPLLALELPTDHPRHAHGADSSNVRGATYSLDVPMPLHTRIRVFASNHGISPAVLLLATYQLLLHRYTQQEDIIVGMPTMGRQDERFESLVGYFINMVAVRSQFKGDQTFADTLAALQLTVVDGVDHAAYPFPVLVRDLKLSRLDGKPPVFQVAFEYQNASVIGVDALSRLGLSDLTAYPLLSIRQEGEYELTLEVHESKAAFGLSFKYDARLHESDKIQRMAGHFLTLLDGVLEDPTRPIKTYPLLTEQERQTMLRLWNSTALDHAEVPRVDQLLLRQALKTPDAVAVSYQDVTLSYRELDDRVETLARYLRVQGVGREQLVGIHADRSPEVLVSLLGVLRAGGAYVPLDPTYPPERLQYMLQDCGACLVLTQRALIQRMQTWMPETVRAVAVDAWQDIVHMAHGAAHGDVSLAMAGSDPGDLAYVIYTSGSTGKPKGVMIEHRSLTNFLQSMALRPGLAEVDRLLAVTTYSFDIAGLELFLPLIVGAQCCICPSDVTRDVLRLRQEIARVRPTVMQATPATWSMLFQSGWRNPEHLRALCGGEPMPQVLRQQFAETATQAWNLFGPTETTIWSTAGLLAQDGPITIGVPIGNTQVYVLDRHLQPMPMMVPGELHIGGEGLARGYLNQSELSEEKFIADPFNPEGRLYKTGDLARWTSDGQIEHLGRVDTQIKLRGYRIEVGEIEARLNEHELVCDCAVVVHDIEGHKQLAAHYVPASGLGRDGVDMASELRRHLKLLLPDFMVPSRFMPIQVLPLTPSGKIDRLALAKRDLNMKTPSEASEVACTAVTVDRTDIQGRLLAIWRKVLRHPELSLDDHLLDSGGDSLLAISLAERISLAFDVVFTVTDLFRFGNVRQTAEHLIMMTTGSQARSHADILPVSQSQAGSESHSYPDYYGESLAIVGMSCQVPGAQDYRSFWSNLRAGKESFHFFSADELRAQGVPEDLIRHPALVPIRASIEGKDCFDAQFFKVSPRDAELMDPQARLLLQHAWSAVEDAGYVAADMPETAVFMSVSNSGYNAPVSTVDAPYVMTRTDEYLSWVLAQAGTVPTLISHKLGLKGPSYAVHSNCSSSLIGLHAAFQTLRSGDARAALVGGATIFPVNGLGYVHQRGMNFSGDGHVRTFDAQADGMISGEGVAVVVVKRALDAIADGDHIYGLIRGIAVNNDGADKAGFYAPSVLGQGQVIDKVLRMTGVHPESIGYVEAHGTGTTLGDPIEFAALCEVYSRYTDKQAFCGLGSVKTNVGHLDTVAGLAACIKVAMSLSRGEIPATLNYTSPNPGIPLDGSPFHVVDALQPWPDMEGPRRAAVSCFGIGGTNAHAILEQGPQFAEENVTGPFIVPLSARTSERLKALAQGLLDFLGASSGGDGAGQISMASLAYTLQVGRQAMQSRQAFVVTDAHELIQKLATFCAEDVGPEAGLHGEGRGAQIREIIDLGDSAALIDRWIDEHAYHKLARAWINGLDVDWKRLYGRGSVPRRISLPTYPFAKDRYWVSTAASLSDAHVIAPGQATLHPLLNRNTSHLGGQRFSSRFTGQEFFLRDHRVQGQAVLPGVAYLEMARAAIVLSIDHDDVRHQAISLENVVFARPVVVKDGQPVEVHIGLHVDEQNTIEFEIHSGADSSYALHSQGRARLMPAAQDDVVLDWTTPVPSPTAQRFSASDGYEAFSQLGFNYGPAFQALTELFVDTDAAGRPSVLAHVQLPSAAMGSRDAFGLHPSVLDGALQACVGMLLGASDRAMVKPAMPFAVERVEIHRPLPDQVTIQVAFSGDSHPAATVRKFDLHITDAAGHLCVRLLGYSSRVIGGSSIQVSGQAQRVFLSPHWVAREASALVQERVWGQRHVVACELPDSESLTRVLAETWPAVSCHAWHEADLSLAQRFTVYATRLMAYVQSIFASKPAEQVLLQVLVPALNDGAVLRALAALLKSASQENPRLTSQLILIAPTLTPDVVAQRLCSEACGLPDPEVRYAQDVREVLELEVIESASATPAPIWKAGGTYLITGGMGGLGRLVAADIARQAPSARLVLTGRSDLSAPSVPWMQELRAQVHCVDYRAVDISSASAVQALISEVLSDHGRIDGVVHAAGVLRDGFILKKSIRDMQDTLAPKVTGLLVLDEATAHLNLDCFVMFSSIAGVIGNVGQADYAAANAFMDAYAAYRDELVKAGSRHGRTLAIDWPLWAEGGMQVDAAMLAHMERTAGMTPLSSDAGLLALHQAVVMPAVQIAVMNGDAGRLLEMIQRPKTAMTAPREVVECEPATPLLNGGDLKGKAVRYLCDLIGDAMKLPTGRTIDAQTPLDQYGLDSIMVMEITNRLESSLGSLSKTLFFEYQTVDELAGYFVQEHQADLSKLLDSSPSAVTPTRVVSPQASASLARTQPLQGLRDGRRGGQLISGATQAKASMPARQGRTAQGEPLDIAIIGISGRYPKARNLREFWGNLTQGLNCITEIPEDRWSLDGFFDPQRGRVGRSYTKWGGFIEGMDEFDPQFFGLTTLEAQVMDPQERVFLQCVHSTLEDAGYTRESLGKRHRAHGLDGNVGVFVGAMYLEYQLHAAQQGYGLNGLAASLANRVSYTFNFHGPSLAVDAMCSASLTAIHMAAHSLLRGECEVAVAGGVNLNLHQNKFLVMSLGQFASSEGLCRSFGEGGDGYVASEGVGAVLLKPLARAIEDGDQIHGVIKGSALSHSGKTSAYTVPNPNAQAQAISQALRESGLPAEAVSYIEAHGTGTVLGDPIEIAGLSKGYGVSTRTDGHPCPIGSVKSNIGHCESAGGMAGLTKVLLQMKHRKIVPNLHSQILNKNIHFANSPFFVNQTLTDWHRPVMEVDGQDCEMSLAAGISSYGAGGSNNHMIVEEYVDRRLRMSVDYAKHPQAMVFSAKTSLQLKAVVRQFLEALRDETFTDDDLIDIAYTLQVGRQAMAYRLALQVQSMSELVSKLTQYADGQSDAAELRRLGIFEGDVDSGREALEIFQGDEDLQAAIQVWMDKGKLTNVLNLWVKGQSFDWYGLYTSAKPRRISLPTYPFARERYWMPSASKEAIEAGMFVNEASTRLEQSIQDDILTFDQQDINTINQEESHESSF